LPCAIIASVNGWRAACLAVALLTVPMAGAAEDLNAAARDLARKTAAAIGKGEPVAVTWRNLSSLGSAALMQARSAFDAGLRDAGVRSGDAPSPAEAQITISENASAYLLIEEIRKEVWIASWKRTAAEPALPAANVEKRLLWEQEEPILDAAVAGDALLVLTPSALLRIAPRQSVPVTAPKPPPRDVRGRLRVAGAGVQVHLPGVLCSGSLEPALTLACKPSDEPWTLESGSRAMLLASFAATRNYFDGRVVTQNAVRKNLPPFYSAAAVDEGGRPLWLLATVAGRAEIFDAAMDPAGAVAGWGSDIAGIDTRCGGASIVLATRPGDGPDAIQAFTVVNRAAVAMGEPAELPGPVTALWPSGIAIVHNAAKGKYQAYALKVTCGS
jgi:hypothetical protein